jgi:hypothetical protein
MIGSMIQAISTKINPSLQILINSLKMVYAKSLSMVNAVKLAHTCMTEVKSSHVINFRTWVTVLMVISAISVTISKSVKNS